MNASNQQWLASIEKALHSSHSSCDWQAHVFKICNTWLQFHAQALVLNKIKKLAGAQCATVA